MERNYDSDYQVRLATLEALGGDTTKQYDSVYEIDLEILRLTEQGSGADIQTVDVLPDAETNKDKIVRLSTDNQIYFVVDNSGTWKWEALVVSETQVINDNVTSTETTWSSSKIDEELQSIAGTANSEFDGKTTEDFTFVTELPVSGEEGQQVIIKGENVDTLYKYVSDAWVEQTPDANILYFDTVNEALYSYITAEHQFAPISIVNTIVVGKNLNSNVALKNVKEPGVYNVLQRTSSTTKGEYTKKWTLTVEGVDYDEYELTDSVYQKLQSNYTIQKRTWSSSRQTNDGWTTFATYYAGEIKDTKTSKYYTWSSNKLSGELATKQNTLTAGTNIDITNDTISAKGYTYDDTVGSIKQHNIAYGGDSTTEDNNVATGTNCAVFGQGNTATSKCTLVAGESNNASNSYAVVAGYGNTVSKMAGVAFGRENTVAGQCGFAEGYNNNVTGQNAHAEGRGNTVSGQNSHAEGWFTTATGKATHSEGLYTDATGDYSHAEGWGSDTLHNLASGEGSHAEGIMTMASGKASHAEGYGSQEAPNTASAIGSHVEGVVTFAQNFGEHAEGRSNISHKASDIEGNAGNTQHSVGIGNGSTRTNAFEIMQNADMYIKGVGGYDGVHIKGQDSGITVSTVQEVIAGKQDVLTPSTNITIDASNNISADGYVFDSTNGAISTIYRQDVADGGALVANTATGLGAFAEGYLTTATGNYGSHAEGSETTASDSGAHAEGFHTTASGKNSHTEGDRTIATSRDGHAEGWYTTASGRAAHSEGLYTEATGDYSHAEGQGAAASHNLASGTGSHAEGLLAIASGTGSHAEGYGSSQAPNRASAYGAHAEGCITIAQNKGEHAEGNCNVSHKATNTDGDSGNTVSSIGIAFGDNSGNTRKNAREVMQNGDYYLFGIGNYDGIHIKGEVSGTTVQTLQEVITGKQDTLTAGSNISISSNTISADGYVWNASTGGFAEKYKQDAGEGGQVLANTANALGAHAEGYGCTASGDYGSHAEGNVSVASGYVSHAEGNRTISSGIASHTEGVHTTASSKGAHAEGAETNATGTQSHAEGGFTTAQGLNSHAEGEYTIATNLAEHAEGNYNISHTANNTYGNAGNTQHSVGIGSPSTHKNAFEIMQNGDAYLYGVGGYQGTDTKVQDATIKTLQEYIASLEARISALENPNA